MSEKTKTILNLDELESQAMSMLSSNANGRTGMNNRTILIELLQNGTYPRASAPVKAATLWFSKLNQIPSKEEYLDKIVSIKNSLDTLISNYNNKEKIQRDPLLKDTKLINNGGMISIE